MSYAGWYWRAGFLMASTGIADFALGVANCAEARERAKFLKFGDLRGLRAKIVVPAKIDQTNLFLGILFYPDIHL